MMMWLVVSLLLAACTGVEDFSTDMPDEPQAISFGAYVNRGTTRAGATGPLTTDSLKTPPSAGYLAHHYTAGFGVFAYYSDGQLYNQTQLPNFMYNQQVQYNATSSLWEYSPVKYWPNETGTGIYEETDRLTFFAYAPYIDVNASTGRASDGTTSGILSLTRANESGDPYVRYCTSFIPGQSVDLCWAIPHIDETKPAVGANVSFAFKHALAALNVQIDADIDDVRDGVNDHNNALHSYTRIYVRSVTFEGFAEKGQLNLYSTNESAPIWNNLDCDCDLTSAPITIYDGRRDGHEGMTATANERLRGLNPSIVQSGSYTVTTTPGPPPVTTLSSPTPGVTNTAVNLFDSTSPSAPIYVIPTPENLRVTIVYDVETYDPKLIANYLSDGVTHGSKIKNTITADIKNGSSENITMQAGKQYNIGLHLGMTSVSVDAEVTTWSDGGSATVDLPNNN